MEEQVKWETSDPKRELLLGFWFGVGAALGAKMFNNLEELISIE